MVTIVLPAYNEEKGLKPSAASIIEAARQAGGVPIEIIIVNDGSSDRTADVIKELEGRFSNIRSIHQPTNLGLGASFLAALAVAKGEKISLFPSDNATSIYAMKNVLEARDKADIVIGYFINTEVRTRFRNGLSTLFNLTYNLTFGIHIKYVQGSPCYPVDRLRSLPLTAPGYSLLSEINVKMLRSGASFIEVDGYYNPDIHKSSAIRLKSLYQAVAAYVLLIYDVHFRYKAVYNKRPRRVMPEFPVLS